MKLAFAVGCFVDAKTVRRRKFESHVMFHSANTSTMGARGWICHANCESEEDIKLNLKKS